VPAYQYASLDAKGRQRKGLLEADTPRMARQSLREQGLNPLSVEEVASQERGGRGGCGGCESARRTWH
jgi:general secretion pathway protein F